MTYHVVFDISERIPQAVIAAPAIPACLAAVAAFLIPRFRPTARRYAWVWLVLTALGWAAFTTLNIWGPAGLFFGLGLGAVPLAGAIALRRRDPEEVFDAGPIRARWGSIGLAFAAILLAVVSLEGKDQWPAFELQRQLESGDVTVTTGVVTDTFNPTWQTESFSVGGREYSFHDGANSVGFHQTTANAGPIHDGLNVRVWSIGDVIVRLEVAD